jgi:hypothetical protein
MGVNVWNVVGWLGWIAIITVIVRVTRARRATAKARPPATAPKPAAGRREAGTHPDLAAGLALGHVISELHHGDPATAHHLGDVATGAYWAGAFMGSETDDDIDDDLD